MKSHWVLALGVATLGAVGCGDDEEEENVGTAGTGGAPAVMCTPGDGGACQNEMDCPKVVSGEARMASQLCGLSCQQEDDPAMCAVGCIVTDAELTQACAICYATLVGCAAQNCVAQCGADAASMECVNCQIESGCRGDFDACSGLTTAN